MRIEKDRKTVGVLIPPGGVLITEDEELVRVLEGVALLGNVRVQQVIEALNVAGYLARGAYLTKEAAEVREGEMMLYQTGSRHQVGVRMTFEEDFVPAAKTPPKTPPKTPAKPVEATVEAKVEVAEEPKATKKKGGLLSWLE